MKTSLLGYFQRFTLLALVLAAPVTPTWAATEPVAIVAAAAPAPIHLAWDRVGSPIQIRA